MLGADREHHEPDVVSVGDHCPHPRDDGGAIDHLWEQGVGVRPEHRRHEGLLGLVGPELGDRGLVLGGDLNQLDLRGGLPGAVPPGLPVIPCHPVDPVVRDLVTQPERRPGVPLEQHPHSLQDHRRRRVVGVEHAEDPGDAEHIEAVRHQGFRRLDRIPLPPVLGGEGVTDLGGATLRGQVQREVAQGLPGPGVANDSHPPLPVLRAFHLRQFADDSLPLVARVGQLPILIASHLGVVSPGDEGRGVPEAEGSDGQSLGFDGLKHDPIQTPAPGRSSRID